MSAARTCLVGAGVLAMLICPPNAGADGTPGASPVSQEPRAASPAPLPAADPDLDVNLAQPDFTVSALPTTLRLPRRKLSFRMTHRFNEPLDEAGLGDMFGMDAGAQMGFEFRYGVVSGAQVGFYRTSDQTIEFFGQYDVARQGARMPVGLAAYVSVEGASNFQEAYAPGVGAIISRELGTRAALYAQPFWVSQTNVSPSSQYPDESTMMVGFGARVRVLQSTYLVAEVAPRLGGFAPGTTHASFGIEKRAGGHLFQLTIANNQGTTLAHVARGGPAGQSWYLGFNLSRKFY